MEEPLEIPYTDPRTKEKKTAKGPPFSCPYCDKDYPEPEPFYHHIICHAPRKRDKPEPQEEEKPSTRKEYLQYLLRKQGVGAKPIERIMAEADDTPWALQDSFTLLGILLNEGGLSQKKANVIVTKYISEFGQPGMYPTYPPSGPMPGFPWASPQRTFDLTGPEGGGGGSGKDSATAEAIEHLTEEIKEDRRNRKDKLDELVELKKKFDNLEETFGSKTGLSIYDLINQQAKEIQRTIRVTLGKEENEEKKPKRPKHHQEFLDETSD